MFPVRNLAAPRLCSVLLAVLLISQSFPTAAYAAKGDKQYKEGVKAEIRKNYDEALQHYNEALDQNPGNSQFMLARSRAVFQAGAAHVSAGRRLQEQGKLNEALAEFQRAAAIDPSNDAARQEIARTNALLNPPPQSAPPAAAPQSAPAGQAPQPVRPTAQDNGVGVTPSLDDALGPVELKKMSNAPINLRMTNESRIAFETIGKLAGINVLFDPDFQSKRITIELNNVSLEQALDEAALLTKNFWKPLTQNTIVVMPDTAVKRREEEEQVIKTFYLSNPITPQELTEAVTAIRSLLETRRIQQINSLNAIIIRDTPDKVAIAEKIIRDIDKAKPEVVVDVAVIEARRDKTQQLGLFPVSNSAPGIQVPATFTGAQHGTTTTSGDTGSGSTPTTTTTIPLSNLGKLSTADFSLTMPGATLNALLSDGNTRVLQRPEVRATDGQKASLRIGDRLPIATGSFQPGIGGVGINPLVNTQFQYIDVGVNLDITPKIHANNEISLKVRVEVSQKSGETSIGGIVQPIIGQRIIDHDIRLREGEINVLGGLMQTQTTKTVTGVPGLSQIPLLKYLFSNVSDTLAQDEVLIVLVPHTVRLPSVLPLNERILDVGTETDVHLRSSRSDPDANPVAEATPSGSPGARMRFDVPSSTHRPGETFQVPLRVENARNASSASFEVSYDPGLMKLLKVSNGGFLGQDGQPVAVVERDDDPGKAVITLNRPPSTNGMNGDGTLAVLTFQADRAGTASVGIAPARDASEGLRFSGTTQANVTIQ